MLFGRIDVCTREREEQSGCVIDMIAFPGEQTSLTLSTERISCSFLQLPTVSHKYSKRQKIDCFQY